VRNILDNPIWHGLCTGNEKISKGNSEAKFFSPNVSIHAGLRENDKYHLEQLYELLPVNRSVTIYTDKIVQIPNTWCITNNEILHQMVYTGGGYVTNSCEVKLLNKTHTAAMMNLTEIAKPGPFFERTIDLGNYNGIFCGDQLIAMAGYRFQPDPYIEISAVCTHPNHLRKGHAALIINNLVCDITRQSFIPFLHVKAKNSNAILLYEKLGFTKRRELNLYTMLKH
jgi:ribosomal protein S18 acetylase RimI-like enzyme